MALLEELEVRITGDASGFGDTIREAKDQLGGLANAAMPVATGLTMGLAGAATAVTAFAVKSAADVGGALKDIQKDTGLTGSALESLKASFKDVFGDVAAD